VVNDMMMLPGCIDRRLHLAGVPGSAVEKMSLPSMIQDAHLRVISKSPSKPLLLLDRVQRCRSRKLQSSVKQMAHFVSALISRSRPIDIERARFVQLGERIRPIGLVRFIVVDVEMGGPSSHQLPSFADRLDCGRELELHRPATLLSMDRETHVYILSASRPIVRLRFTAG
jgi:hypothetical protein